MRMIAPASKRRYRRWSLVHDDRVARRSRRESREPRMIAMRDAILELIAELRTAGVRISVAESLDAMRAVAAAGIERRRMREALAAALIKEEADRGVFDEAFARRFGGPAPHPGDSRRSRGERAGIHGSSGGPSESSSPVEPPDRRDDDLPAGTTATPKPSSPEHDPIEPEDSSRQSELEKRAPGRASDASGDTGQGADKSAGASAG